MERRLAPIDMVRGEIELPGDKSISHRVVFIGGIAEGRTEGKNFLEADDCIRTISSFRAMGIDIKVYNKCITVNGKGLFGLCKPSCELFLGNSGTTMRLLPGILSGQDFEATLTGDESLSKRPMDRIIEPLKLMGVNIRSKYGNNMPPLIIKGGKVKPISYRTKIASAQVKSCILFAGLYAEGSTGITEPYQSRDHTERLLRYFGAELSGAGLTNVIRGRGKLYGRKLFIPGDISSAAFFIGACCILPGSELIARDVGINPTRMGFINILRRMGADISIREKEDVVEPFGDVVVRYKPLKGVNISKEELPLLIDEVPILCIVAGTAKGKTVISGVSELRIKESDRVYSIIENLQRAGVKISSSGDKIIIVGKKGRFKKTEFDSFNDHRIAMSMAISALNSDGDCTVKDADCVDISFPGFFEILDYIKR